MLVGVAVKSLMSDVTEETFSGTAPRFVTVTLSFLLDPISTPLKLRTAGKAENGFKKSFKIHPSGSSWTADGLCDTFNTNVCVAESLNTVTVVSHPVAMILKSIGILKNAGFDVPVVWLIGMVTVYPVFPGLASTHTSTLDIFHHRSIR